MTLGDPVQVVYLDVFSGIEIYFGALAGLSLLLIVRAVWRSIAGG
jgi:hypothetical protein